MRLSLITNNSWRILCHRNVFLSKSQERNNVFVVHMVCGEKGVKIGLTGIYPLMQN